MKKWFVLSGLLLLFCGLTARPAAAQGHSVTLAWTASPTTGLGGYNAYRAPCTGTITAGTCSSVGTFAKIGSTTATVVTITDTTVSAGGLYVYQVTAFCPTTGCSTGIAGESAPSNQVAATIPSNAPNPPNSLTIPNVTMNWDPNPIPAG